MSVKVLLVDDHQIVREGLRSLLEAEQGVEVVAEAADGPAAVELGRREQPDVVVMDVALPGLNGVEATRQILADSPRTRIIALSMHADSRFVGRMLQAGASGYLLKDCAVEEVTHAIHTVLDGGVYLSPGITGIVVTDYVRQAGDESSTLSILTAKEREVLQLLAEGWTTKRMALEMHLSPKTIETHRAHIMKKLDMDSVAKLTRFAIREGLSPFDR